MIYSKVGLIKERGEIGIQKYTRRKEKTYDVKSPNVKGKKLNIIVNN